jgi:hypothetical protein
MSAYSVLYTTQLVNGQPEDISQVKANFDAIATVINGNIDQTNIAPTATPTITSLVVTQNNVNALRLTGAAAGITFGGDTNLYRQSAAVLQTDGRFQASGIIQSTPAGGGDGFYYRPAAAGGVAFSSAVVGEANSRFYMDNNGLMRWGPGGATAVDTNFYRSAAAILKTDGALHVVGDSSAQRGAAAQTVIGAVGPAAQAGIIFGNALDTNLYRKASASLQTDGNMYVGTSLIVNQTDTAGAKIFFGSALDTDLFRLSATFLSTTSDFVVRQGNAGQVSLQSIGGTTPTILFGSAQTESIKRTAAARLQSSDSLFDLTALGVATKTKAGAPVDGDWAAAPPVGTLVVDTTNNKIWRAPQQQPGKG